MRRPALICSTSLCMIAVLGCDDDSGLSPRAPVYGTVTYKSAPVAEGTIMFQPTTPDASTRAASGVISGGKYSLTTAKESDGALPGDYKVVISAKEVDLTTAKANSKGGVLRQDDVAKANKNGKNLIPAKYSISETSGLTFSVKSGSNTANFELVD